MTPVGAIPRGRLGVPLLLVSIAGAAIAAYLSAVRALGGSAVCGPSHGCDTVAASEYATLLGIPVAYLGLAFSLALVVVAASWWRRRDPLALNAAWVLLLLGTLFVAYLTFLELFVIQAICIWCAAYAVTIVVGLVIVALILRERRA